MEGKKDLNPDFSIENLLRAEIPANMGTAKSAFINISSIFLLIVGVATPSKKNLAGMPVFIGLSTLITISTAKSGLNRLGCISQKAV
jgi:hypothetical protein